MMTPPEWFSEALEKQSKGKFRIRWSVSRDRWQIEEKAARSRMYDRPVSILRDELIREYDGYTLFAEVCPGTKMKCDRCFRWVGVAQQKFKTTRCSHCRKEHKAFFWVLGESLLEHMRKVDPDTGGIDRVFEEVDQRTAMRDRSLRNDGRNQNEAAGKDSFNFIHEIPTFGYTGKNKFIHRQKGLR